MTYRPMALSRWFVVGLMVVFTGAAVAVVVATARGAGPPIPFLVFWLFAFAWNFYWWMFRICFEVGVFEGRLHWRSGLVAADAPVDAVRAVRRSTWTAQFAVIEVDGRRPLLVPVRYGFGELARCIAAAAPQARVEEA